MTEKIFPLTLSTWAHEGQIAPQIITNTKELYDLLTGEALDDSSPLSKQELQTIYTTLFIQYADADLIEQYFAEHPDSDPAPYLNNFYTLLPDGYARRLYTEEDQDMLFEMLHNKDYTRGHSDKYLATTPKLFFQDIDSTMDSIGLSAPDEGVHSKEARQLNTYHFPLYLALRRKGYSHRDLKWQIY